MTNTQAYFVDIINLVPDCSTCYIQAPSTDNLELITLMEDSHYEYYKKILLTSSNKRLLCELVLAKGVEEEFHNVEIRMENKILFEGYDGMEYGTISKELELPVNFVNAHFPRQMYTVSKDW